MWLKACPRCRGDLYRRDEPEGPEIACLQCSRIYAPQQLIRPVEAAVTLVGATPIGDAEAELKEAEIEEAELVA